jgi:hypothetical protein
MQIEMDKQREIDNSLTATLFCSQYVGIEGQLTICYL